MRLSKLFGRTLRQVPSEAETAGHQLLLRASLVRQVAAGIYSFLPLGWRAIKKIEDIMRAELDAIDGQEMLMPVLNPAELWQESGRWYQIGSELIRLEDRAKRAFVLAMTHEEIITELASKEIRSYRQLPFMAYQIQTKVRDEARPRGGLIRLREFLMKDGYSFHPSVEDLDDYYPRIYQAYSNIFSRCGLNTIAVDADPGMIGGTGSHEFVMLTETGEDKIVLCPSCGYAANMERAEAKKKHPSLAVPGAGEEPMKKVSTPGVKTIEQLERFFGIPAHCFLKTVMYSSEGSLIAAVLRGDQTINEIKLARAVGRPSLGFATEEELKKAGIHPGFVSPVGLKNVFVIADDAITQDIGFIAGANEPDAHLDNVMLGRDYVAERIADIAEVQIGEPCVKCGQPLEIRRGIEVGHTFKLGTKYSEAMGAEFLSADSVVKPIVMGCYGIGLDRLMASIVEQSHDDKGIIWPLTVAPFQIQFIALGMDNAEIAERAETLYSSLVCEGYEVLFDDRVDSPGVKFNDADLMGMPLRLTISPRTVNEDSVEMKLRTEKSIRLVKIESVLAEIKPALATYEQSRISAISQAN